MPRASEDDKQALAKGLPYVRSIAAFILFIRFGSVRDVAQSYKTADLFIEQLRQDMDGN